MKFYGSYFLHIPTITLFLACVPGGTKIPDQKRIISNGTQIQRSTDSSDCNQVTEHAQNIFLTWAKNRINDNDPVSPSTVSALMGLGRYESGGGRGINFANVTMHRNESRTNKQGWDGSSLGSTRAVESFISKYKPTHETNFAGVQISPNVVVNYNQEQNFLNFVNRFSSVNSLYLTCQTDMAYYDKADALRELTKLFDQKNKLPSWFATIKNYTSKSQSSCRASASCVEASSQIGRWLSYCPRLNLDLGAVVFETAPQYFGARKKYARKNPRICQDMIAKELKSYSPNDLTPRIASENPESGKQKPVETTTKLKAEHI